MPYCRCPKCGAEFHIRPAGDPVEWYREHAPHKTPGELVDSLLCLQCWKTSAGNDEHERENVNRSVGVEFGMGARA